MKKITLILTRKQLRDLRILLKSGATDGLGPQHLHGHRFVEAVMRQPRKFIPGRDDSTLRVYAQLFP